MLSACLDDKEIYISFFKREEKDEERKKKRSDSLKDDKEKRKDANENIIAIDNPLNEKKLRKRMQKYCWIYQLK